MIAIICAMEKEARVLIQSLQLRKIASQPFLLYGNKKVVLLISKIGKVYAALGAMYVIQKFSPRLVINVGVCGRLNPNLQIGEVVLVKKTVQHDLVFPKGFAPRYLQQPISCKIPSGVSKLKQVILLTGDAFVSDRTELARLRKKGDIVDMEGYSIALACHISQIPCVMIKAVSDGADEKSVKIFAKNLPIAMRNTVRIIENILRKL